ncbi:hypothetical protein DEU56DRAFT_900588 [Suillus clintonianus]|uniref:uncharacterized protein n=1 Tax=Suillus clintonianus TaxID=1904413 RepID=UPI001B861662|nr:uncharacterized protein DEU56DRAFT_900588 [Suillus clintonianus]KAG2141938.1 hypothetical protein DEU56DRAFT_900588 [Suillus clintonianus]
MQPLDGTANSGVSLSAAFESDIIGTLRNTLARSREIISADLETSYSRRVATITNHSVVELEDQSISAIINERQQQFDATLHEISELETAMDDLKILHWQLVEKKDKITQSMNLHKQLVSALWRLPTEVLSHIFVHCLPETSRLPYASKRLAPVLLTRICRRWREVAVGTSNLWCRLMLQSSEDDNKHWESMAFCYDLWLKRSRGLPLSLEAWCDTNDSITKFRGLIQPYINQISSFYIRFVFQAGKPELMFKDLPTLQELTLYADDNCKMRRIAQSMSQLLFAMRSLKVTFPMFNLEDFSAAIPLLARLTNIEVTIDKLSVVPHLLHLCPNLSSLTIRTGVSLRMQPIELFIHPKLRSLRIAHHLRNAEHLSGLFDALSLPDLRLLEARYIESSQIHTLFDALPPPKLCDSELEARFAQPWPHAELKALLARSNCPLEGLNLGGGVMMTDEQRAEYVALIPSLDVVVDPMRQDHTLLKQT